MISTKVKIALQSLTQKVQRGILTEEQAKKEFVKITGHEPDATPDESDENAESLGKYLEHLSTTLVLSEIPVRQPDPQDDQDLDPDQQEQPEQHSTVDLSNATDKMVDKRLTKAPKVQN